jgi:small subunit ribosomal protein S9
MANKKTKKDYLYAVGRRKEATARVRLYPKKGDMLVNQKPADEYFPGEIAKTNYLMPFKVTGTLDKFSFSAKVEGSGINGQLKAISHGLSRALVKHDPEHKIALKQHGLLTRDSRMKERRKVGTGGKARRKKQSPKR